MKKLVFILGIALFLFGCTRGVHNTFLDMSYDPIDYPPQFFTLKDKRPVLYIDPVVDNRKIATKTQMGITF